ncbi:MAG: MazG nucleotide pyrophosphohydrolase domain-containing protein [Acidimicrobiaceae bacterium]
MSKPVVRVVGLGPSSAQHLTAHTTELLTSSPVVRLRTRIHPAADAFSGVSSYDDYYDSADSFEVLYPKIVDNLVELASTSPNGEVVYAVPGSPMVAERTVELLRLRSDVEVICEPAISVIDVACARLGKDPMALGLRVVDALGSVEPFRGPGPLLILQTYAPEILASVADRLPRETVVTVLHHVGLDDEVIKELPAMELVSFDSADHLTSLWVEGLRTAGESMDDLVDFMRRLRAECPWDQEQTHASLTRHLLEEAYETLDALETFVRVESEGGDHSVAVAHVEEELGDLLFQIVFHAELGDEEGHFNFATIADGVRDKLTGRHPHVFGDVEVSGSEEVASRWEDLKKKEKGRESVTDGIAWQLPALTLYAKLLRKAQQVDLGSGTGENARAQAISALQSLNFAPSGAIDSQSTSDTESAWGDALSAIAMCAQWSGVDLEGVLRERALQLRSEIQQHESSKTK